MNKTCRGGGSGYALFLNAHDSAFLALKQLFGLGSLAKEKIVNTKQNRTTPYAWTDKEEAACMHACVRALVS